MKRNTLTTSDHGSLITKSIDMISEKMDYHYKLLNQGWKSINVDSSYLGYWFNEKTKEILSFCEGSIKEYTCPNFYIFNTEISSIRHFIKHDL